MVVPVTNFHKPASALLLNKKVGRFLRRRRLAVGLTGAELARILHLSQQQISRYECGVTSMTLYQLTAFMLVLEGSWEAFAEDVMGCESFCTKPLTLVRV